MEKNAPRLSNKGPTQKTQKPNNSEAANTLAIRCQQLQQQKSIDT
jgi:hypothetical protein